MAFARCWLSTGVVLVWYCSCVAIDWYRFLILYGVGMALGRYWYGTDVGMVSACYRYGTGMVLVWRLDCPGSVMI